MSGLHAKTVMLRRCSSGGVAILTALLLACTNTTTDSDADGGAGGSTGTSSGGSTGGTGGGGMSPDLRPCVPDGAPDVPHVDVQGAVYAVPVPPALEPYASYPLGDVSLCTAGATLELGYSLPALLVGKKTRVSFAGPFDPSAEHYELGGKDGTASCTRVGARWTCNETFVGVVVDLEGVADETAGLDPTEAAARIDVATIFGGDPIGILDFDLP